MNTSIASVRLEGHSNREVVLDGHSYHAYDESFRYSDGPDADRRVYDTDPVLADHLDNICSQVEIDWDQVATFEFDTTTCEVRNLLVEQVDAT